MTCLSLAIMFGALVSAAVADPVVPDSGYVAIADKWFDCTTDAVWFHVVESPPSVILRTEEGTFTHWSPPAADRDISHLYTEEELEPVRNRSEAKNRLTQVIAQARARHDTPGGEAEMDDVQSWLEAFLQERFALGDSMITRVEVSDGNPDGNVFFIWFKDLPSMLMLTYERGGTKEWDVMEAQTRGLHTYVRNLVNCLNQGDVLFLEEGATGFHALATQGAM